MNDQLQAWIDARDVVRDLQWQLDGAGVSITACADGVRKAAALHAYAIEREQTIRAELESTRRRMNELEPKE